MNIFNIKHLTLSLFISSLISLSGTANAVDADKSLKNKDNFDKIRKESTAPKTPPEKNTPSSLNLSQWAFVPAIVATVGDKNVTKEEFLKEIQKLIPPGTPPIPQDELPAMAHKTAEKMVNRIVFDKIVRSDGIIPSSELVKKEFNSMLDSFAKEQVENLILRLKEEQGMTLESYVNALSQDENIQLGIAINKWLEKNIAPQVKITDNDIEKYYRENQSEFRIPESVRLYHILIRVNTDFNDEKTPDYTTKDDSLVDLDKANLKEEEKIKKIEDSERNASEKIEAIRIRLLQGEDFGRIAENESDCPISKSKRGDLGYLPVNENKILPEFEKAVAKLKINEISKPVKTKYGYHILKITERKKESYKTLDSVKDSIKEILRNKAMSELHQKYLEKEKNTLKVKINI